MQYNIDFGELNKSEQAVAQDAASDAFALWEKDNPGLVFKSSSGADVMTIKFVDSWPNNGFAMCVPWDNSENYCHVIIRSDMVRISSDIEYNKKHTAGVLAHEIGHVLGFMHTSANSHLMHGYDGCAFNWTYESEQAFVVPKRISLYN